MEKEKVVFFLDYANINRAATDKRYRLDYHDLLGYVSEGRFLIDAHCYVPINPRNEHRMDREIQELWRSGYIVTTKVGTIAGGTYKCNFDVEITMDILKVVYQVKPDIIVLATSDSDFVSLIQEVRKSGIRVEVAAFEDTTGADIMNRCSGFIDLDVYYEDYLAAQNCEQDDESTIESYKHLIQSQVGEESVAEQYEDLIQSQNSEQDDSEDDDIVEELSHPVASDVDDSNTGLSSDQLDNQTSNVEVDIIDEVSL
jgi:uncharacterized LabA/DUF88 family protein